MTFEAIKPEWEFDQVYMVPTQYDVGDILLNDHTKWAAGTVLITGKILKWSMVDQKPIPFYKIYMMKFATTTDVAYTAVDGKGSWKKLA